jgi:hypothetical protein
LEVDSPGVIRVESDLKAGVLVKGGSMGKSMLPKQNVQRPGVLGRTKIKEVEGRTGYTDGETRFGPPKGAKDINLPKAK